MQITTLAGRQTSFFSVVNVTFKGIATLSFSSFSLCFRWIDRRFCVFLSDLPSLRLPAHATDCCSRWTVFGYRKMSFTGWTDYRPFPRSSLKANATFWLNDLDICRLCFKMAVFVYFWILFLILGWQTCNQSVCRSSLLLWHQFWRGTIDCVVLFEMTANRRRNLIYFNFR